MKTPESMTDEQLAEYIKKLSEALAVRQTQAAISDELCARVNELRASTPPAFDAVWEAGHTKWDGETISVTPPAPAASAAEEGDSDANETA